MPPGKHKPIQPPSPSSNHNRDNDRLQNSTSSSVFKRLGSSGSHKKSDSTSQERLSLSGTSIRKQSLSSDVCVTYLKHGKCPYDRQCKYEHVTAEEVANRNQLVTRTVNVTPQKTIKDNSNLNLRRGDRNKTKLTETFESINGSEAVERLELEKKRQELIGKLDQLNRDQPEDELENKRFRKRHKRLLQRDSSNSISDRRSSSSGSSGESSSGESSDSSSGGESSNSESSSEQRKSRSAKRAKKISSVTANIIREKVKDNRSQKVERRRHSAKNTKPNEISCKLLKDRDVFMRRQPKKKLKSKRYHADDPLRKVKTKEGRIKSKVKKKRKRVASHTNNKNKHIVSVERFTKNQQLQVKGPHTPDYPPIDESALLGNIALNDRSRSRKRDSEQRDEIKKKVQQRSPVIFSNRKSDILRRRSESLSPVETSLKASLGKDELRSAVLIGDDDRDRLRGLPPPPLGLSRLDLQELRARQLQEYGLDYRGSDSYRDRLTLIDPFIGRSSSRLLGEHAIDTLIPSTLLDVRLGLRGTDYPVTPLEAELYRSSRRLAEFHERDDFSDRRGFSAFSDYLNSPGIGSGTGDYRSTATALYSDLHDDYKSGGRKRNVNESGRDVFEPEISLLSKSARSRSPKDRRPDSRAEKNKDQRRSVSVEFRKHRDERKRLTDTKDENLSRRNVIRSPIRRAIDDHIDRRENIGSRYRASDRDRVGNRMRRSHSRDRTVEKKRDIRREIADFSGLKPNRKRNRDRDFDDKHEEDKDRKRAKRDKFDNGKEKSITDNSKKLKVQSEDALKDDGKVRDRDDKDKSNNKRLDCKKEHVSTDKGLKPNLSPSQQKRLELEAISDEDSEQRYSIEKAAIAPLPKKIGIHDSIEVDWLGLLKDVNLFSCEKLKKHQQSAREYWASHNLLARMGVSTTFAGAALSKQVEQFCNNELGQTNDFCLLDSLGAMHAARVREKEIRESLFTDVGPYRRALCARRDLAIRRYLCRLTSNLNDFSPPMENGLPHNPELYWKSVQLFMGGTPRFVASSLPVKV